MFEINQNKNCVLIIDDDPEVRVVLANCLREIAECVLATSAEAGLIEMRKKAFAVVVCDYNLPGMKGLHLVNIAKTEFPETSFVMISGDTSLELTVQSMRAGVFDFVFKPFDLIHIEATVKRAAERYDLLNIKKLYEQELENLVEQRTAELDKALNEAENSYRHVLKSLVQALETRDFESQGHSERAVTFSLRLGYELGLSDKQLKNLEFGTLLHDVGKIGVPDTILRKPERLDEEEWKKMKLHPVLGHQILRGIPFLEASAKVVLQHHEHWDGKGYPLGLKGTDIDENARIFAVVDAFDALTSNRVYRRGRDYTAAVEEIRRCSGTQFDPNIVEAFCRIPQTDWNELREHSLAKKPEVCSFRSVVEKVIKSNAPAEQKSEELISFSESALN